MPASNRTWNRNVFMSSFTKPATTNNAKPRNIDTHEKPSACLVGRPDKPNPTSPRPVLVGSRTNRARQALDGFCWAAGQTQNHKPSKGGRSGKRNPTSLMGGRTEPKNPLEGLPGPQHFLDVDVTKPSIHPSSGVRSEQGRLPSPHPCFLF